MNALATPGPYDALEKLLDGEPYFALIGRDECAPAAITEHCRLRRNRAFRLYGESHNPVDKELLAAELLQCREAEEKALEFTDWRQGREAEPTATRSSYQEVIRSAEEIAEADRRKRRATAVQNLRESAYYLCEAKNALLDLELIGAATETDMVLMLARMNGLADEYREKRGVLAAEPALPLGEGQ